MSNKPNTKPIQVTVLEAIKSRHLKMRPRWYFILKSVLVIAGSVMIVLALLFLVSFIFFVLRQTGVWFVPIFGLRGIHASLLSIPWLLIIISIIFLVVLEFLAKHYAFAYRRPLLYSAVGIIVFAIVGGAIVARTPLHGALLRHARENRLPFAGQLYRGCCIQRLKNIHRGTITEITDNDFRIINDRGETLTVIVTPETRFPYGINLVGGDSVVVFGDRDDSTVRAFGIRKVDDWFEPGFRMPGHRRHFRPPPFD